MSELQKAILAGLLFGVWPIAMNRSGLSGSISSAAFAGMVFLFVLPFALREVSGIITVNWVPMILAGITAGMGVLFFNGILSKATHDSLGTLFISMILAQIAVPAVYQMIAGGGLTLNKGIGILLAIGSAFMLNKR